MLLPYIYQIMLSSGSSLVRKVTVVTIILIESECEWYRCGGVGSGSSQASECDQRVIEMSGMSGKHRAERIRKDVRVRSFGVC